MPVSPSVFARMRRQQRAYWPDGHIRIGDSVPIPGKNARRPVKLSTWRFTSPSKAMVQAAADLYGGEVAEMTRGDDKWQVITNASQIPVVLPPHPVTQWMEHWDGPYCMRRCDGETIEHKSGRPCLCRASGEQLCKIRTRVSVLLADVPSLGTWLLATGGWNAAEDLPSRAELAQRAGDYIDAWLLIREGRSLVAGKPATYPIPRLQIEGISPRQVMTGTVPDRSAVARHHVAQLTAGATPPAEAAAAADGGGRPSPPPCSTAAASDSNVADYVAQAATARSAQQVRDIWMTALAAGQLTPQLKTVLNTVGAVLAAKEQPPGMDSQAARKTATAAAADAPGEAGGEELERLRRDIIAAWPRGTSELHEAVLTRTGTTLRRATREQLIAFAASLPLPQQDGQDDVVEAELVDPDDDPDDLAWPAFAPE
ncbi:recombination directionality factor [Nonomuraea rubra]